MGWGSKTQVASSLSVAGTEQYTDDITLNPGEQVHIQVKADFPGSPTDNLVVSGYGTLDDSSEVWDDTAFLKFEIDNGTDPNHVALVISGFYKFKLGFIRSGSTDTITVDAWIRKDGVSI